MNDEITVAVFIALVLCVLNIGAVCLISLALCSLNKTIHDIFDKRRG